MSEQGTSRLADPNTGGQQRVESPVPSDPEPSLEVRWGTASDTGVTRAENQDAVLAQAPIFLVADGMGGHRAGRTAADLVTRAFAEHPWGEWATPGDLAAATVSAQAAVTDLGQSLDGAPGSTVTGVAMAVQDGAPTWLVFNVGDSRTYLLRNERLRQVTVDHSHRQALVEQGMTPEQARERSARNVIVHAIGGGLRGTPQADQWLVQAQPGDRVLVCSDGLTGELTDPLITAVLLAHGDPAEAAQQLVNAALRAGGRDNVTVLVVDAERVVAAAGSPATDPDVDDAETTRESLDRYGDADRDIADTWPRFERTM